MSELMTKLKDAGADVDGAMRRFLDDTALYEACFADFMVDENFKKLDSALANKNYEQAFDAAHTLKGVAGNMGLTPLYAAVCALVEALRNENFSNANSLYAEVVRQYDGLQKLAST